jgi:hypothetical protein
VERPPNGDAIECRVVKLADGRGLARCGHCGAPLAPVLDFHSRTSIDPWGFTFDGRVFRPTEHSLAQRRRPEQRIGTGHALPTDRALLRRGEFGQRGDPTRKYDPIKHLPRNGEWEPTMPTGWFDQFRLPTLVECPQCHKENHIAGSDLASRRSVG